MRKIWG